MVPLATGGLSACEALAVSREKPRGANQGGNMSIDDIISELEADAMRYRKQGGTVTADYMAHVLEIYAEALRLVEVAR